MDVERRMSGVKVKHNEGVLWVRDRLIAAGGEIIAATDAAKKLSRIARQLGELDLRHCNIPMGEYEEQKQYAREENLENQASKIANEFSCYAYHQPDPRGMPLY